MLFGKDLTPTKIPLTVVLINVVFTVISPTPAAIVPNKGQIVEL